MNDSAPLVDQRSFPRFKVLYLLAVTVSVFGVTWLLESLHASEAWKAASITALLLVQVALLVVGRVGLLDMLRACARVKWLFLFLIVCSTFFRNAEGDVFLSDWLSDGPSSSSLVNLTGFEVSALMCLQITTVILVSMWVRLSGPPTDLVDGLRGLGFPKLFVYSIDNTLALLGGIQSRGMGRGQGGGGGGGGGGDRGVGGGRGRHGAPGNETEAASEPVIDTDALGPSFMTTMRRLVRGDLGFFLDAIQSGQHRARRRLEETMGHRLDPRTLHDVEIISGVGLMMVSMKILKFLPGIAIASGHKTLLLIPLYILASRLTYSRWGGTVAGSIMGVMGLMMGDGRTGVFEVFKHVVPGFVVDPLNPLITRLPHWKTIYCVLGFVVAMFRTSTELALVLLPAVSTGNLWETPELQAFPVAKLIPNLFFGTLSGLVTYFLLTKFRPIDPQEATVSPESAWASGNESKLVSTEGAVNTSTEPGLSVLGDGSARR